MLYRYYPNSTFRVVVRGFHLHCGRPPVFSGISWRVDVHIQCSLNYFLLFLSEYLWLTGTFIIWFRYCIPYIILNFIILFWIVVFLALFIICFLCYSIINFLNKRAGFWFLLEENECLHYPSRLNNACNRRLPR